MEIPNNQRRYHKHPDPKQFRKVRFSTLTRTGIETQEPYRNLRDGDTVKTNVQEHDHDGRDICDTKEDF